MEWHIRISTKPDSSSASIIQLTVQWATSFNRDVDSHVNKNYAGQYESRDFYPPLKTYLLRWTTLRISFSFLYVECELLISWLALGIYLRYWYEVDSHYLSQESTHNPGELCRMSLVGICLIFYTWLDWGYGLLEEDHKGKVLFLSHIIKDIYYCQDSSLLMLTLITCLR